MNDARQYEPLTKGQAMSLWRFLRHGSAAHRQWLLDAIKAWNEGKERPEPYE